MIGEPKPYKPTAGPVKCLICSKRDAAPGRLECKRCLAESHAEADALLAEVLADRCPSCKARLDIGDCKCTTAQKRRRKAGPRNAALNKMSDNPLDWIIKTGTSADRAKTTNWWIDHPAELKHLEGHTKGSTRLRARCTRYGITLGRWMALVARQDGRCGICQAQPDHPIDMHIDHDHDTEHVRGLLCSGCNTGLGHLGIDGPDADKRIRAVLAYFSRRGH